MTMVICAACSRAISSCTGPAISTVRDCVRIRRAQIVVRPAAGSMPSIPFPGHKFEVISMDYNMTYNQSRTTNGDPDQRPTWRPQAKDAYLGSPDTSVGGF